MKRTRRAGPSGERAGAVCVVRVTDLGEQGALGVRVPPARGSSDVAAPAGAASPADAADAADAAAVANTATPANITSPADAMPHAQVLRIVSGAVPGDLAEVALLPGRARGPARARLLRVLEPSRSRVEPRCPLVVECGGCPWQPVAYAEQRAAKARALEARVRAESALAGLAIGAVRALAAPGADEAFGPHGYRTKLQFAVGGRAGALALGLYQPGTHAVTDLPDCPVQHPDALRALAVVRSALDRARVPPCDERTHAGVLRHVLIRVGGSQGARAREGEQEGARHRQGEREGGSERDGDGEREGDGDHEREREGDADHEREREVAVVLVVRTADFPERAALLDLLANAPEVTTLAFALAPAPGNVVLQGPIEHVRGRARIRVEVGDLAFALSPGAFFQTSVSGAAALVEVARALAPERLGVVVDLYAGVGLFARALAPRAARVIAVEESAAAIADLDAGLALDAPTAPEPPAAAAAAARPPARVEAIAAPVEACLASAEAALAPVDLVVVDPPRRGLAGGVGRAIAERLAPARILYVSCEPATLIRDLADLAARGYVARRLEPLDLFPHTPRLECVALLERVARDQGRA